MEIFSLAMEAADANLFKDATVNKASHPLPPPTSILTRNRARLPLWMNFTFSLVLSIQGFHLQSPWEEGSHITSVSLQDERATISAKVRTVGESWSKEIKETWNSSCAARNTIRAGSPSVSRDQASSDEEYHLYQMSQSDSSHPPITIPLFVNDKQIEMELDTGASVAIIPEQTRNSLFPNVQLRRSMIALKTYTNELMAVAGQLNVRFKYGSHSRSKTGSNCGAGRWAKPSRPQLAQIYQA